jgi:hypothetical protein
MKRKTLLMVSLTVLVVLTISPIVSTVLKHGTVSSRILSSSRPRSSLAPLESYASNLTLPSGLIYEQDCNDPDNPLPTWVCAEPIKSFLPPNYEYYVGHDEPLVQFYSTAAGSGYDFQWKIQLPQTDPSPTQDGTRVANGELYPTFWFSVALCDPASTPFNPCTPLSDSNTATAGSAILELQFYPPGRGCSGTQWCASMTIDELTTNCGEPITSAPITTDGTRGGPRLLMSAGDSILITIKDTSNGLENDVNDLTSSTIGSMVASGANGFTQTLETTHSPLPKPIPPGTCPTSPYSYHPEYATASPGNLGSWINANVDLAFEIGHSELCGDSGCATLPDSDSDDTSCGTILGVGICTGGDNSTSLDGLSYVADWPDGTSSHPSPLSIGAPSDNGFGPESVYPYGGPAPLPYSEGYSHLCFGRVACGSPAASASFFPFFSQAGTGAACNLNFGNDIPGTTTNDFGKTAQYTAPTMDNPCLPGSFDFSMSTTPLTPSLGLVSYPTILRGETAEYQVTVNLVSGTAETVTLISDHTKEPTGSTSSFSPASVVPTIDGATSTFTIVTSPTGGVGNWILHIHGSSTSFPCPSILGCKTINPLTSLGTYDFTVNVSPSDQTVLRGASTSYTANLTRTPETFSCFPCPFSFPIPAIALSTSGLPVDATSKFTPQGLVPTLSGATTILTVSTAAPSTGSLGDYSFTVVGSEGNGGSRSGSANLHIYDFTVTASTSLLILETGKNSWPVTLTLTPGSSIIGLPTILLSEAGLPAGATGFLTPTSGSLSFTSTFNVTTLNAPAGNYTLALTGTDSRSPEGGARTATPVLTVLTPQQANQLLINQVNALQASGVLTPSQASSLTSELMRAINSLNAGNTKAACNQLNSFVNTVNALVRSGKLTQAQADQLLDPPLGALSIMASLSC